MQENKFLKAYINITWTLAGLVAIMLCFLGMYRLFTDTEWISTVAIAIVFTVVFIIITYIRNLIFQSNDPKDLTILDLEIEYRRLEELATKIAYNNIASSLPADTDDYQKVKIRLAAIHQELERRRALN